MLMLVLPHHPYPQSHTNTLIHARTLSTSPLSSFRMITRCHWNSNIPSATKQYRTITQDKTDNRHLDNSFTSFSTSKSLPRSPRPHSTSPQNDVNLVAKPRRHRRNLARMNYCELDQTDAAQPRCNLLDIPSTLEPEHRTDQDSIGWDHFIRSRLSLSFTPVVADYYRANKLGWRFTTNNCLLLRSPLSSKIHQQA